MSGVGQGQLIDRGHGCDLNAKIFSGFVAESLPAFSKKKMTPASGLLAGHGGARMFSEMRAGEKKKVVGFLLSDQYSLAGGVKSVVHRAIPLLTRSSST